MFLDVSLIFHNHTFRSCNTSRTLIRTDREKTSASHNFPTCCLQKFTEVSKRFLHVPGLPPRNVSKLIFSIQKFPWPIPDCLPNSPELSRCVCRIHRIALNFHHVSLVSFKRTWLFAKWSPKLPEYLHELSAVIPPPNVHHP